MSETADEAAARRRRANVISVVFALVIGAGWVGSRVLEDRLPEDRHQSLNLGLLVAVMILMVVFVLLMRRQWSEDFRRAMVHGEVAPDANREELRRDLRRARRGTGYGRVQTAIGSTAALVLAAAGLWAQLWWLFGLAAVMVAGIVAVSIYSTRQRQRIDRALAALDA